MQLALPGVVITFDASEPRTPVDDLDLLVWLTHPEVSIHLVDGEIPQVTRTGDTFALQVYPKSLRHAGELARQLAEDFGLTIETEVTTNRRKL